MVSPSIPVAPFITPSPQPVADIPKPKHSLTIGLLLEMFDDKGVMDLIRAHRNNPRALALYLENLKGVSEEALPALIRAERAAMGHPTPLAQEPSRKRSRNEPTTMATANRGDIAAPRNLSQPYSNVCIADCRWYKSEEGYSGHFARDHAKRFLGPNKSHECCGQTFHDGDGIKLGKHIYRCHERSAIPYNAQATATATPPGPIGAAQRAPSVPVGTWSSNAADDIAHTPTAGSPLSNEYQASTSNEASSYAPGPIPSTANSPFGHAPINSNPISNQHASFGYGPSLPTYGSTMALLTAVESQQHTNNFPSDPASGQATYSLPNQSDPYHNQPSYVHPGPLANQDQSLGTSQRYPPTSAPAGMMYPQPTSDWQQQQIAGQQPSPYHHQGSIPPSGAYTRTPT